MSQQEASEAAPGFGAARRDSYSRLAVADGLLAFTIIAVLAAGAGITDKLGDSLVLLAVAGLLTQFALQALINMASTVNLMPPKGMTLPLISYGGSSTLALGFALGMVLALTRYQPGRGGVR